MKMYENKEIVKELKELVKERDEITTSDLQGIVDAIAWEYGYVPTEVLDYYYELEKWFE